MNDGKLGSRIFSNPGQRIKDLSTGVFVVEVLVGLVIDAVLIRVYAGSDAEALSIIIAILVFLLIVGAAYCSSLFLYGFGELITNTDKMRNVNQPLQPIQPIQATVNPIKPADELRKFADLLEAGALTREEFENQKRKLGF